MFCVKDYLFVCRIPAYLRLNSVMSPGKKTTLFEISLEVCRQVGGIYTVLKTKAPKMTERHAQNYYAIGPYFPEISAIEFEECEPIESMKTVIETLAEQGIICHYGTWLITGRPQVILIDFRLCYFDLDLYKYNIWHDHHISIPRDDHDLNEAIAFGFALTEFFKEYTSSESDRTIIAHFHEWMSSVALPRIAFLKLPIRTIFTTHATLLGRYMAADNANFHQNLKDIQSDSAAQHYAIAARHAIEKAAAHSARIFTTVSETTQREAEHILGRRAEHILPNGINSARFSALHELQLLHLKYKKRIHEFVMSHFFPTYSFDLDRTIYLFTSGRYEYRNKGMDVFIESLYRLNQMLKQRENPPTVVAFIITRAPAKNINVRVLQNRIMFDELKRICTEALSGSTERLIYGVAAGNLPTYEDFLPETVQSRLLRSMHANRSESLPPIVTHDMNDDRDDAVLRHLRHRGLYNAPEDPVKIVYHPEFLTAAMPLLALDYDQFVRGCHLGVFPSYYEPWGYTPPECLALGLPTVTSDLSGFGMYAKRNIDDTATNGIFVLQRSDRNTDESIEDLAAYLDWFAALERRERIELRNRAEKTSSQLDWSNLIRYYDEAHADAMRE